MDQPFSFAIRLNITNVTGQLSIRSELETNPATGIKIFPVANENPYTMLQKDEATTLLKTIDTARIKRKMNLDDNAVDYLKI